MGNQVGWGGYFRWALSPDSLTECYTNAAPDVKAVSEKYEKYFYPAIFADFAARMDWAACGEGNHNPSVYVNGKRVWILSSLLRKWDEEYGWTHLNQLMWIMTH